MKKIYVFCVCLLCSGTLSAQQAKVCDQQQVYSLDETAIKNAWTGSVSQPKKLPLWPKGKDSLQTYIDLYLDLNEFMLTKQTFRYNFAVLINCKGEVAFIKEISKGAQDTQEKTAIGAKIEKMLLDMKGWIPATTGKNIQVDCLTKMVFTINNEGKKISYKEM